MPREAVTELELEGRDRVFEGDLIVAPGVGLRRCMEAPEQRGCFDACACFGEDRDQGPKGVPLLGPLPGASPLVKERGVVGDCALRSALAGGERGEGEPSDVGDEGSGDGLGDVDRLVQQVGGSGSGLVRACLSGGESGEGPSGGTSGSFGGAQGRGRPLKGLGAAVAVGQSQRGASAGVGNEARRGDGEPFGSGIPAGYRAVHVPGEQLDVTEDRVGEARQLRPPGTRCQRSFSELACRAPRRRRSWRSPPRG